MYHFRFSCLRCLLFSFMVATLLLLAGCAKDIQLTVVNPAQVDTSGIQKVAVGRFELAEVQTVSRLERNGQWQEKALPLSEAQKTAISNQIRARVISSLATVPYFDLVYTDEFAALENDAALQQAIAAGGFRTAEVDAVINGKFWINVVHIDGVELDKTDLAFRQGGRKGSFIYDLEVLVYWPYKSINGSLGLELKLTRLDPTEVLAVTYDSRSYSRFIGGKPPALQKKLSDTVETVSDTVTSFYGKREKEEEIEESKLVLPNFEQLVADLAESIAAQFNRRVTLTQKTVTYPVATGGDSTAILLLEAGAYEKAIEVLTKRLDTDQEKNPADIYNLGLCFEATGDYGLAAVTYADAVNAEPDSLLYAQGVGRIERMKRENRRLRQQLSSKQ